MNTWYRVFGASDSLPAPAEIEASLANAGVPVSARFLTDERGWHRGELTAGLASPVILERWLTEEEGIRAELNSWAAFLETCDHVPEHQTLMEQVIQAKQLFTILESTDQADNHVIDRVCLITCQHLARATRGIYQVDEQGFFAADGTLLVREQP